MLRYGAQECSYSARTRVGESTYWQKLSMMRMDTNWLYRMAILMITILLARKQLFIVVQCTWDEHTWLQKESEWYWRGGSIRARHRSPARCAVPKLSMISIELMFSQNASTETLMDWNRLFRELDMMKFPHVNQVCATGRRPEPTLFIWTIPRSKIDNLGLWYSKHSHFISWNCEELYAEGRLAALLE